jgi:predicted Zn finger-like uncharacterized protein
MDVTCERCGTEYEFDETLVSVRGTTVKCTNCGHLFKVFRPGAGPNQAVERAWKVRRRGGGELELGSLKELQRRITEGSLDEEDEISRSGESFKRLGDIAELRTFFAAARAEAEEGRPTRPRGERRDETLSGLPVEPSPFQRSPSSRPEPNRSPRALAATQEAPMPPPARVPSDLGTAMEPPRVAKETLFGVGHPAPSSRPPPRVPAPPPRPAPPPPRPAPRSAAPRAAAPDATAPARPRASRPAAAKPRGIKPTRQADEFQVAATANTAPEAASNLRVDDDDDIELPVRGGRHVGRWFALLLLLALGGVGFWQWPQIAPLLGVVGADRVDGFLAAGDAALARDDVDGYEDAVREFTRATALAERDPRVLRALARAHSAWAQALAFQASDLLARAGDDASLRGEAAVLQHDEERIATSARRYAEDALRLEPGSTEAEILLANALRQTGDAPGARGHLDRASEMQRERSAEYHLVAALLATTTDAGVAAAREEAAAAVEADPSLLRARLLLARADLASGRAAEARTQLDAVLAVLPEHPRARRLIEAMEGGLPPAAPLVAILDGGAPDAANAAQPDAGQVEAVAVANTEDPSATEESRTPPDEGGGSERGVPAGRDYGWYVGRADQYLESGDVGRARTYYEAALRIRPGSPEAQTGLGFVALNSGNASGALNHFRPAAAAGYGDAFIGQADAYRRMGRDAQALEAYRRYVQRRPTGQHAAVANRQIAELSARLEAPDDPPPSPTPPSPPDAVEPTHTTTPPDPRAATPDPRGASPDPAGAPQGASPDPRGASPDPRGASPDPRGSTPSDPRGALPAPRGTDPDHPPPSSDSLAIGNE